MKYTENSINTKWTTESGNKVDFTYTVTTYAYDFKLDANLTLNDTEKKVISTSTDKNVIMFSDMNGNNKMGLKITDELASQVRQLIDNAKIELAPRVKESNAIDEAEYRAERS